MTKSIVEHLSESEVGEVAIEAATRNVAIGEIVLGMICAIDAQGHPIVSFPQATSANGVVAITTIAVRHQHIGRQVALLFANGDLQQPVIMGLIHSPLSDLLENFSFAQSEVHKSEVDRSFDTDHFASSINSEPSSTPMQNILRVDGKRISIEGKEEIVLSCGESSITLTKAGKILIRGKYLLSRSSGVNRILGGSVQVN